MVLVLIVLLPVLSLSLWWFYRSSPGEAEQRLVWLFNAATLAVGVLICTVISLRLQAMLADTSDRAWWPALSTIVSLVVLPLWLAVCGVVRNLLVFPSGKRSR